MVFISPGVGGGSGLSDSGYFGGSGLGGIFVSMAVTMVEAPVLVVHVLVLALVLVAVLPL